MEKKVLNSYETSYVALITISIVQIFLAFLNIYNTQSFSIENFTVVIIGLISILIAYFWGLTPAAIFSIGYIIGGIIYVFNVETKISMISYILWFFVPLSTIFAGNMNRIRKEIVSSLAKLEQLKIKELKIDANTSLENEYAFKEVLLKNANLAKRYSNYSFSTFMFRLEFIDTLRILLEVREFNSLLESIAEVIQKSIREEDYKFIVSNNRFVIITPLTSTKDITPAIRRILEGVGKLNIKDKNGDKIDITLKAGGLDYSENNKEVFEDYKKLLLALQKATEVDIYGEYSN